MARPRLPSAAARPLVTRLARPYVTRAVPAPVPMRDTFTNLLAGLGVPGRDKLFSQQYSYTPLTLRDLEFAYRSDWLARKVVDIPAFDMTREWRAWQADEEQVTALEDAERTLFLQNKLQAALVKARLYGGSAIIIGVEDPDPALPLEPEAVGRGDLKWLHVVAAQNLNTGPLIYDVTSPWYGQPSWYQARVSRGVSTGAISVVQARLLEQVMIHPSRVVRLVGLPTPDVFTANTPWGDSVLQPVNDAIKACGLVTNSLATLISELKIDVIKIPNLTETLSTDAGTEKVRTRFANANVAKSVINMILIDAAEEWQRVQANLGGISDLLMEYFTIASGAADIPATRFLGRAPKGLNATGESDMRNYYDRLHSEQTVHLQPAISILDEVLIRSALGDRPDNVWYEWNSLWQLDEEQKGKIAFNKAQAYKIDVDAGMIPTTALAKARINQLIEDGFYPGLEQALDESAAAGDTVEEFNTPPEPPAQLPPQPPGGPPQPPPQPGGPPAGGNGSKQPAPAA